MTLPSTKPYLVRAVYEWCSDCGYTPYLSVRVDGNTRVPMEYVRNGEIVFNVSQSATRNLTIDNERIQFSARFAGVSREISIPIEAVGGIFGRECGHGILFMPNGEATVVQPPPASTEPPTAAPAQADGPDVPPAAPPTGGKSHLKIVK